MEILEALDATECAHSAAVLAGCDPKTVRRYGAARDGGTPVTGPGRRPRLVDEYAEKIEEWVDRSEGRIRADRIHERLVAMGFPGTERTTRRAVGEAKARWRAGHRRTYRPWITEPGLWLQFDWGDGPVVPGPGGELRKTVLFCAWLAWSRFRVVLPCWDRTLPTLMACLDATLRAVGGVPSFLLTDNEKTVTVEHVAGVPVRHPDIVAAGRHYGCTVHTCVPYDPESKGGAESTVKIAKADLVPTGANLRPDYASFAELRRECAVFCERVNTRVHRATAATPAARLEIEATRLHRLPPAPHTLALGETRKVATDQTVTFGSVRYSTPPGLVAQQVWVRADGEDLVVVADLGRVPLLPDWVAGPAGLAEIARHRLSTPGHPRIDLAHYPGHPQDPDGAPRPPEPRPATLAETEFLALGPGAHSWLIEAAATGTVRVRAKMAAAVELDRLVGGGGKVDTALGLAAAAGRFAEDDLASILAHHDSGRPAIELVVADESHSVQPGTSPWADFGRPQPG